MHLAESSSTLFLFMDWSFASGCSPPRISTTQLPSATDRPVFPSGRDFHPSVGAYFQAHLSHSFTVLSPEPEARVFPSGLHATLVTALVCPSKVLSGLPVAVSQSFTMLSREPEARVFPSGLQATL